MSHLAEELARQLAAHSLNSLQLAERSGISASQIYKWANSTQTSIDEDQLTALAPALSPNTEDHASLVRAHLLDEKFGPGSELVRVEIDGSDLLKDRPRMQTKREQAISFLSRESLTNRDLQELLIDLARCLGTVTPTRKVTSSSSGTDSASKIPDIIAEDVAGERPDDPPPGAKR